MKKFILMNLFLFCCLGLFATDKYDMDGRTYYMKATKELNKPTLFIWCHPAGGNAKNQFDWWVNANIVEKNMIFLCPQSKGRLWSMSKDEEFTISLIKHIVKKNKVNKKAIIIGGHSSGAVFTYNFGLKYQRIFSDLLPACGLMQRTPKPKKGHKPIVHIYHGKKDRVFTFNSALDTKAKLVKLRYKVKFTESDAGHNLPIKVQELLKEILGKRTKNES